MATPEVHAAWCAKQFATYMADKACYSCGAAVDLALMYKKRWWVEVSLMMWAQTKSNLRGTLNRTHIACRPCTAVRLAAIRAVLESGVRYDKCQDEGCAKAVASRGFCTNHRYLYMRATGLQSRGMAPRGEGTVIGGYRRISAPGHPNADRHGRLMEHRKVLSEKLGRPLWPGENAHHKNGDKLDNRPDNLELWVVSQPSGQRAGDLVAWAKEIIVRYADEVDRGLT